MRRRLRLAPLAICAAVLLARPAPAACAESADEQPAFSLASGAIGSTKAHPDVYLTFRRIDHLDFRVYRVTDPLAFIARLKDPHQLGSEEPVVDQEPTLLERIASWKAARRAELRDFVRAQFSVRFRVERQQRLDTRQVAQRQVLRMNTFAQVPLLNTSQLVTAWRETLPPVRDPEFRRIPLDLAAPGMYVVEGVYPPLKAYTVVIVSDVGVVTKAAPGQVLLFAANRFTGRPVADCATRIIGDRAALADGRTGTDGVFAADLGPTHADDIVAVTRCGDQVAATDPGGWFIREKPRTLVGYIYTDKPIYRPGHSVHVKAVLRWRAHGALMPFDRPSVEFRVIDPTDKVVARTTATVDAFGSVQMTWPVPAGAALGRYSVQTASEDDDASGSFEVQEYRKPEYEVRVTPADRFVVQGAAIALKVDARYYFGQPVARARVHYVVHQQPYYSPFRWTDDPENEEGSWWYAGDQIEEGDARLSEAGTVDLKIAAPIDEHRHDYSLRIDARVTDAGGRDVSGRTIVHCTYGSFMVVAATDEYVKRPGSQVTLTVRTLDYQGTPVPNRPVNVSLQSRRMDGDWNDAKDVTSVTRAVVTTDDQGRASWTTTVPAVWATYRLHASAASAGRPLEDDAYFWVQGRAPGQETESGDRYLELIADRRTYAPGDTARLLVQGETVDADVLVTKEGQHVSWHQVMHVSGSAIDVPVGPEDIGDTWVNIAFLRNDRLFRAERRLRVPATARQLQVTVTAAQPTARPRDPATFVVQVADAGGQPVRAQVSVGIVDEAVYGVKPDDTPDPLRFFYRREYSSVGTDFSRTYSFVGYSGTQELTLARLHRPSRGLADFKGARPQPQVRKEFPDAIFWVADLVTDAAGRAEVTASYPDALTTWRLTARAVTADTRVGAGIGRTTTTKDLIVRPILPRFLTEHDEAIVPVVTHNYLPQPQPVAVSIDAQNLTFVSGPAGAAAGAPQTVAIASGAEQRLEWTFRADRVGTASVTARATTPSDADAVQLSFPVLPFGVKQETSGAGALRSAGEHALSLAIPVGSNPSARTIRVTLAPSLAGSVLGALDYLTDYPYGCTEQTLSSFLPTLLAARALSTLGLTPTERLRIVDRQVTAGIAKLLDMQHDDGGWGWWKTDENHPFMTAYALFGLVETRRAGYKVDAERIRRGVEALSRLYGKYPRMVPALKAYITYVMLRADAAVEELDRDSGFDADAALGDLWSARDRMTPYGKAILLEALDLKKDSRAAALARELADAAIRTGDLAYWKSDDDPLLDDWADTSIEATATAIAALAPHDPRSPLLDAGIRYLVANRTGSYWISTKQTAMTVYGLLEVMKARQEHPEPFDVDVMVNGRLAGTASFTAQSIGDPEPIVLTAPAQEGANDVRIVKRGGGALYWSATAESYDTTAPVARTGSRHLAIVRHYFSLTPVTVNGRIVYRETPFSGTAAPGDVLLVRIAAAGSQDWRYLLIEDPLPAGAEPIADDELYALETSDGSADEWWSGRREFRDDRAVFFRDRLPGGRTDLHYVLKITTPGSFQALPARVVPMYVPGVRATSDVQPVRVPTGGENGGTP